MYIFQIAHFMKHSIVWQYFLGQFCPRGKGATRLTLYEAPTRKTSPDHNTDSYVPYTLR